MPRHRARTGPAAPVRGSGRRWPADLAVCAVALLLAVVFTRGMTSTFDSVRYANVAHWIAAGRGIATSLTVVPVQEGTKALGDGLHAFTIQPPGLPLFYALAGVDRRAAAHALLHVAAYPALAWLVLGLGIQLTGRVRVGVTAALLTVSSPVLLLAVSVMWTDLPAATLLLGALWLTIRSRAPGARAWAWLLAASVLAALAVSLRLTSLAFAAVPVADAVLSRALPRRARLVRLAAGAGVFGAVAAAILLRNVLLAGAPGGTAPHEYAQAPVYSFLRAGTFLGARLLQALSPGWALGAATGRLAAANAGPAVWPVPGILGLVLAGAAAAAVFLRRRGRLAWPAAGAGSDGAAALTLTSFLASVLVLLLPAGRHAEFRAVEFRFLATLLPLVWLGIAALVHGTGRRLVDWPLAAVLVVAFAAGVPGRYEPYRYSREFMRPGLAWLRETVPADTPVLTNNAKALLEEDLERRVFHLSDWNFRHVLGPGPRTDEGLLRYLRERGIGYVVLFGRPDLRQAGYWGRPIIGLFLGQRWTPWRVYRDEHLTVYRIPAAGPPPAAPEDAGR